MRYLTFQHEMTHYQHINLQMNAQTLSNNNEILSCVHPVLKIHFFYCASWSYTVTLVPLLHLSPKWEDS
jgi:hypothetical protein